MPVRAHGMSVGADALVARLRAQLFSGEGAHHPTHTVGDGGNVNVVNEIAKHSQTEALEDENNLFGATKRRSTRKIQEFVRDTLQGDASKLSHQRGAVGESILHVCFLFPSPENLDLAKWLLTLDPHLIDTVYTSDEYRGENVLHMAIVAVSQGALALADLEWLIRASPRLVHGHAVGAFFQPSQQPAKVTCAWGETALNFAVALNQPDIVRLLVERAGADMLDTDCHGNTCMHIAVKYNRADMIDLLHHLWDCTQLRLRVGAAWRPPPDALVSVFPRYQAGGGGGDATDKPLHHAVYSPSLELTQVANLDDHVPLGECSGACPPTASSARVREGRE